MQWVLCGPMTSAVANALIRHEHRVHQTDELGLEPAVGALDIFKAAQAKQWDILTTDAALAAAPFEGGARFDRTIVFLQLEGGDVEQDDAIDRLFDRYRRLSPKRL